MLPSPSLAPPWLSASASPALGPCGIPLELEEVVVVAGELEEVVVVAAAPPEPPEDVVVELLELEEFEPQADTASAAIASRQAVLQRIRLLFSMDMNGSFVTS